MMEELKIRVENEEEKIKIIPLFKLEGSDHFKEHCEKVQATLVEQFGDELSRLETLPEEVPLVRWEDCERVPGAFPIYLLASGAQTRDVLLFFQEMVSHWLIPSDHFHILSARNLTFRLNERGYLFVELLVKVEREKNLSLIAQNLPGLAQEIRLGALSTGHAKHVLEMKRMSMEGKTSYLYETLVTLVRRYPHHFGHDVFRAMQHFLIHCREDFRKIRHVRHLCRIFSACYLFQRALQKDLKTFPHRRHLYLKLTKARLHYPFGLKRVLGIVISLNTLHEYERFERRHIAKAVERVLPGLEITSNSYISDHDSKENILTFYLELEKHSGADFSLDETKRLRAELPHELKNSIEFLTPSLFIPRNDEELFRDIIALSQELRYVRDLPQAVINFHEQKYDVLRFNVILVRLLKQNSLSLQDVRHRLPPDVRFMSERIAQVGLLRKRHVKEANLFSLDIPAHKFLRKNHSVDLVRARQYVGQLLERMVGNFRDYNGGFLLKQNQQLDAIKREVGNKHEILLENLFYALTPSVMQTLIAPKFAKNLFSLFLHMLDKELSTTKNFLFEKRISPDCLAIVVKTKHMKLKQKMNEVISSLHLDLLKLASASVEVDGLFYFAALYIEPSREEASRMLATLEKALDEWVSAEQKLQIMRLHLPRAALSLDPRIGADRTSGAVLKMLYEGLMRIDRDGKPELALAKEVKISSDCRHYTFKLKESVWSNGVPVTAHDFEYAWKKILDPNFRSAYNFLLYPIKGAEAAKRGEITIDEVKITAQDAQTLVVELEYPAPYFLSLTAHWTYSPLCQEIDQSHPGWAYHSGETYVCNGPFKLEAWKFNDDLQLAKNPLYWDVSKVRLDKIEVSVVEDQSVAFELFKRGELDWYGDPISKLPIEAIPQFKAENRLITSPLFGMFWLQINLNRTPFQSRKMRQAFGAVIDRNLLVKGVLQGEDTPAYGIFEETKTLPDKDLFLAQRLFQEGLDELGLTREQLPAIVFSHSEIAEQEHLTYAIGKMWTEAFGITVKYERLLWNTYFETLNRREFMIGGIAWYSRYDDPLYFLDVMIQREQAVQVTEWKHPKFIELIGKAKDLLPSHERNRYMKEAETLLLEDLPVIPLFFQKLRYVKNPRLKGVYLSDVGQMDFKEAYFENSD